MNPKKVGSKNSTAQKNNSYKAIVYFHGMGIQSRYEEISRLIDSLDQFANSQDENSGGKLRQLVAKIEPPRTDTVKQDITYVSMTRYVTQNCRPIRQDQYRLYEAYWSSFTAGGFPAFKVATWLLRQMISPVRCLRASWRSYPRLKRSTLIKCWPKLRSNYSTNDANLILKYYDLFESWDARRRYPLGSHRDFCHFVESKFSKNSTKSNKLAAIARKWRSLYIWTEIKNFGIILTIAMAIFVFCGIPLTYLYNAFGSFDVLTNRNNLSLQFFELGDLTLLDYSVLAISALILFFIGKFLKYYMSDVMFWTAYKETDPKFEKRKEILDASTSLLDHVLRDKNCESVTVIGHSLGSAVAYDALRALGRHNRARKLDRQNELLPLEKISYFVTLGSPIDKIYYFFETHEGKYHRYNRINEQIRGDIGSLPFQLDKKRNIIWVNFWDDADVVSSELHTPKINKISDSTIINVALVQTTFPSPFLSHSAYFYEHEVLNVLFSIMISGRLPVSFWKKIDKDTSAILFKKNRALHYSRKLSQVVAVFIPWCGAVILTSRQFEYQEITHMFTYITTISVGLICLYWIYARFIQSKT